MTMKNVSRILLFCLFAFGQIPGAQADDDWDKGREAYFKGDVVGSMEPLKRAADKGIAEAQHLYGYVLTLTGFDADGYAYMRKSADQGYVDGVLELATMVENGIGTAAKPLEAREILLQLAAKGEKRADIAVAAAYLEGRLGYTEAERNSPEALVWIQKAADAGNIPALRRLLEAYKSGGYGQPPNEALAKKTEARLDELLPKKEEKRSRRRK